MMWDSTFTFDHVSLNREIHLVDSVNQKELDKLFHRLSVGIQSGDIVKYDIVINGNPVYRKETNYMDNCFMFADDNKTWFVGWLDNGSEYD